MAKQKNVGKKIVKEHLAHFNIAGFTYYDGAEAFPELSIGLELDLSLEPQNSYDHHAVVISHGDLKLGYVPKSENEIFYKLLRIGFKNIALRIQKLDPKENPEQQVWVVAHLIGTVEED